MKAFKSILFGLLGMAMITPASAVTTTIRITGSNGDRAATQSAITKLLASGWVFQGNKGNATSASTANALSSNYGAYNGTWNGNPVIIKVSFAGALAGVASVAGNLDARYVVSNGTGTGAVADPTANTSVLGTDYEVAKPDFGFSTNFQSTSPFQGTYLGTSYATLIEEVVGVSPLIFYASPGFPGSPVNSFGATYANGTYLPNITTQLGQLLYTTGVIRLSQFTGDSAHEKYTVFAIGRNTDAGQRFGAYTELGLGTTTAVSVWLPTFSTPQTVSGSLTYGGVVGSQQLWPVGTSNSIYLPVTDIGNGGYPTGATLAPTLTTTLSTAAAQTGGNTDALGGFYIGYLTPSDGNASVVNASIPTANQGVALRYNGVPYSAANVKNGSYTAWVYNRIIRRPGSAADPSSAASTVRDFANALRDQILNVDATNGGGILIDSTFRVARYTDGGLVIPTFY
ncbi:hypothetical protein [Prosthecobacter vanneervenii]|uniref:Uncharacterized protein n=1 Tax=Prosthecobacter vanneervenii TaxID=48466 RepID=A0A7W7YCS1_9BACT|nr:hypothetical protein [Prosthecobacter vanneervenii]MBB5033760.1 hypothetical protein [Prosthecobacter vanneervenii]